MDISPKETLAQCLKLGEFKPLRFSGHEINCGYCLLNPFRMLRLQL